MSECINEWTSHVHRLHICENVKYKQTEIFIAQYFSVKSYLIKKKNFICLL